MMSTVLIILNNFNSLWTGIMGMVTAVGKLDQLLSDIAVEWMRQNVDLKGITKQKNQKKRALAKKAKVIVGGLKSLATNTNNQTLFEKVDYSFSQILKTADNEIDKRCTAILEKANEHAAALADYGITTEKIQAFSDAIEDYRPWARKHQSAVSQRKTATADLRELFKKGGKLLRNDLDELMDQFESTHPDFYSDYHNARKIVNRGIRHRLNNALSGKVTGPDGVTPIEKATVRLVNANRQTETTELGNYTFDQAPDGQYIVEVTKEGMAPFTSTVLLLKEKPMVLNVSLQPAA